MLCSWLLSIILQENITVLTFIFTNSPNASSVLIFGAVVQSIGQAIIVFGFVKTNSNKLLSNFQLERQLTMNAFTKNIDQLQAKMQNDRQSLLASYTQTMSKIDHLIAIQKELNNTPKTLNRLAANIAEQKSKKALFAQTAEKPTSNSTKFFLLEVDLSRLSYLLF